MAGSRMDEMRSQTLTKLCAVDTAQAWKIGGHVMAASATQCKHTNKRTLALFLETASTHTHTHVLQAGGHCHTSIERCCATCPPAGAQEKKEKREEGSKPKKEAALSAQFPPPRWPHVKTSAQRERCSCEGWRSLTYACVQAQQESLSLEQHVGPFFFNIYIYVYIRHYENRRAATAAATRA